MDDIAFPRSGPPFSLFSGYLVHPTFPSIVFSQFCPHRNEFLVNHARASSIFVFLSVGYGLAVIVSGLFSGKIGYKKSIVFSLALLGLVNFLIPVVHDFLLLYVFAFVVGFSVGLYLPSVIPLITEYYSAHNWGKAIAIHDTAASTAIFAIPFVALFLLGLFSWRGIFVVFGCIFIVSSVVFHFASSEVKIGHAPKSTLRGIVKIPSLWLMAAIWMFGTGANLGIYSIVPLYLTKELHLNIVDANTILGISRLGAVGASIACGFIVDRFSLRRVPVSLNDHRERFSRSCGRRSCQIYRNCTFFAGVLCKQFFPMGLVATKTFNRNAQPDPV